ncbi:MAG: hypothetical protein HY785_26095 [Oscillatoriophycideae cyanobacterium NC_groundwater_1537_Pr4_S-0.65um_50_18]|nr:hypothetical protein [Oscillatoriophycideae cyanobacterium NC_groundwater_1537_Pr4_S-0.65um_50_18]
MPGFILHAGASVLCSHGGQAQPTSFNLRVTVSGQPIVTQPNTYAIAGCTLPPPTAANGPCVTAQWITAAIRVTSMGAPVLLLDSQAICAPTGTPLIIAATQSRATAL